jgi:hypothetical protein
MQYTPDPIDRRPGHVQHTASQWLYDTENQIVAMNKSKVCEWDTSPEFSLSALSRTSIWYVIMSEHVEPARFLISGL